MLKKSELYKALAVTAEVTGATPTEAAIRLMAERLAGYQAEVVVRALERCQTELRGPLTLGSILDRLEDGHLGPEEAWAMVARVEEEDTVVWTDQMSVAWGAARSVLPDRVAARMAFLEAYRRELAQAGQRGDRPHWWASLGWAAGKRLGPIADAVACGRLTGEVAQKMLPPADWLPEWVSVPALPPAKDATAIMAAPDHDQIRGILAMLEGRLKPHAD